MNHTLLSIRIALVVGAIAVGAAAGALAPPRSEAATASLAMYSYGGSPVMGHGRWEITCGWHVRCSYPEAVGRGVDWGTPDGSQPVYWRSKNYRAELVSSLGGEISTSFEFSASGCSRVVRAQVEDYWGFRRSSMLYYHTQLAGGGQTFQFVAGNGAWYNDEEGTGGSSWALVPTTEVHIGSTVADPSSCWGGWHLHQEAAGDELVGWTDNWQSWPVGIRDYQSGDMLNSVWDKPQAWMAWEVNY